MDNASTPSYITFRVSHQGRDFSRATTKLDPALPVLFGDVCYDDDESGGVAHVRVSQTKADGTWVTESWYAC